MRFDNFDLLKSNYFLETLENVLTQNTTADVPTDLATEYIKNTEFLLKGIGYSMHYRPISDYAKQHFLFLQSFSYFEFDEYYTKRKNLDSYLLKYTYEGEGVLHYDGKIYTLSAGTGFIIDCQKPHEYYLTKGPWKHCEIHFSGPPAQYIYEQFSQSSYLSFYQPLDFFQLELEKLLTLQESVLPARELQISHQLEHILLSILCSSDSYRQMVQKTPDNLYYLLTYLEQHYMKPLSLDFMADFSNISKYHLCRLFREHLDLSPNEYLNRLRIENAKKLLLNTTLPASKIALMVGISDENYFYRLFKNKVGISTGKFRSSN